LRTAVCGRASEVSGAGSETVGLALTPVLDAGWNGISKLDAEALESSEKYLLLAKADDAKGQLWRMNWHVVNLFAAAILG
jgi:hypothetical protein